MTDKWYNVRWTYLDEGGKVANALTTSSLSKALQGCKCSEPGHIRLDVVFVDASDIEAKETIIFTKEFNNPVPTFQIAYKGQVVEEITGRFADAFLRLCELRKTLSERKQNDYVIIGEDC